jgi:hypothetical protein
MELLTHCEFKTITKWKDYRPKFEELIQSRLAFLLGNYNDAIEFANKAMKKIEIDDTILDKEII